MWTMFNQSGPYRCASIGLSTASMSNRLCHPNQIYLSAIMAIGLPGKGPTSYGNQNSTQWISLQWLLRTKSACSLHKIHTTTQYTQYHKHLEHSGGILSSGLPLIGSKDYHRTYSNQLISICTNDCCLYSLSAIFIDSMKVISPRKSWFSWNTPFCASLASVQDWTER